MGGRLQGTWSAPHVAACPWTSGKRRHSGNKHWGAQPGAATSPHPPLTPAGLGSSSHVHQPAWLGLQGQLWPREQSWLGSGAELAGFALSLTPVSSFSHAVASPPGNWRRPRKASAGDPGEDRRGVSLPDGLPHLPGLPASSICKEIDSHSIIELGLWLQNTQSKAGHSGETEAPEVPGLA